MKFIYAEDSAIVLNFMWLPTWIGQNAVLKKEMEKELYPKIVGRMLDEATVDDVHKMVVDYLCIKYPIVGLRDYLDGIKFVDDSNGG
jgi:hypothetical protein